MRPKALSGALKPDRAVVVSWAPEAIAVEERRKILQSARDQHPNQSRVENQILTTDVLDVLGQIRGVELPRNEER